MSLNAIVNKLIDGIEDFGNMFYQTAIKEICIPKSDLAAYRDARREAREEFINQIKAYYERGAFTEEEYKQLTKLPYNKALKKLKQKHLMNPFGLEILVQTKVYYKTNYFDLK